MSSIARSFILMAIVYACLGVTLGIWMGVNEDFSQMHVHAHINLIGWASLALFGIIYHLYPKLAKSPLAKAQFWLAALGTPIFLIGIPIANAGTTILLAVVGSLMVLAAMIVFLAMFWQSAR